MNHEKIYLLTDGCMWEANKRNGKNHPHSMEVVDIETGAVQYITSGSHIKFVKGEITDIRTQEAYNEATTPKARKVPNDRQNMSKPTRSEGTGESGGNTSV